MVIVNILLATFCGLFGVIYLFFKYQFSHWRKLGVQYETPSFPFGNFGENFTAKISFAEVCQKLYHNTKAPILGIYLMFKPGLLINDPEIVRDILVKDSQYFNDRGLGFDEKTDKLAGNLFFLGGEKWKAMRTKLSPTFTSGRMKMMFDTICDCGKGLDQYLMNVAEGSGEFHSHDVLSRFTVNNIISIAFGVEIDCINKKEDQIFHDIALGMFKPNITNLTRQFFNFMVPDLAMLFRTRVSDPEAERFIIPFVEKTIEYREKNNIVRRDFFQLLIQLRNTGTVQLDDNWETGVAAGTLKKFSIEQISAQAFAFFAAGYETTASTISFCLHELAKNRALQDRVRKDIFDVLSKHNNQICYESLNDMKFLESTIDETLRKYPPLPFLNRESSTLYKVRNSDVTIQPKTAVHIPIFALQRDPKYFPDPLQFDPDRFYIKGNMDTNAPYFPFGDGPRICIGLRLGKMTTKIGILTLLRSYDLELPADMKKLNEVEFNPVCTLLTPKVPLKLIVKKRK